MLSLRLLTLRQVGSSVKLGQEKWFASSGSAGGRHQNGEQPEHWGITSGLPERLHHSQSATGCPLSPAHFQSPQLAGQGHSEGLCSALRSSRADDRSNDGCSPVIPDLHLQQQQHALHHGHLEAASAQRGRAGVAAGGTVWGRQEGASPGPLPAYGGPHQIWVFEGCIGVCYAEKERDQGIWGTLVILS